jgi:hypothetical protein
MCAFNRGVCAFDGELIVVKCDCCVGTLSSKDLIVMCLLEPVFLIEPSLEAQSRKEPTGDLLRRPHSIHLAQQMLS